VGIGTTTPGYKLDVNGSVRLGGFTTGDSVEWPNLVWLRDIPNNWDEVNKIINNYSPEYISLILGGSSCSEIEKINRLQVQIDYASKNKPIYEKLKKYTIKLLVIMATYIKFWN
jgi:hypothetical protein